MKKKILLTGIAALVVVSGVAALSAYEAHVINVTAHIENALFVEPEEIEFGTVFPQEYLERGFTINLSESFLAAARVDDVEYKIVQKPKCECDLWVDEATPSADCPEGQYAPVNYATHQCPDGYSQMLDLCEYLSKLPEEEPGDIGELSYYDLGSNTCPVREPVVAQLVGASGRLSKEAKDISDTWTVDLKVPPVEGYVGQDWPAGCPVVSQNDKDYGCDLWIEVTHISLPTNGICEEKPDVMQVLDRSGSVADDLTTLKNAALVFVTALDPKADGAHMGQTSFADSGSLDLHLTGDKTLIDGAINGLFAGGYTNLSEGISLANTELGGGDGHDRTDVDSPDFMVIITDGNPNRPVDDPTAEAAAIVAANAAKAAGVTIYVVGVGTDTSTSAYLRDNIATSSAHYFDAADFAALQAILESIASCD